MNRRTAGLLTAGIMALAFLPASCGGGESGSGGGSTGPGSGTGLTGAGPADCAGGCKTSEVCTGGMCVAIPDHCPCPKETYCDLATSSCKVGCLGNADCEQGRYCDVPNRACLTGCLGDIDCAKGQYCDVPNHTCPSGCRDNNECMAGSLCLDHQCKSACGSTADCKAMGETCVSNACSCPGGEKVCSNACTQLGTTANCGSCGDACKGAATCTGGKCQCEPGLCGVAIVVDAGGVVTSFDVDDQNVYFGKDEMEIDRAPNTGGPPVLVTSDTDAIFEVHVVGDQVVYSAYKGSDYQFKKVPALGGAITTLDSGKNDPNDAGSSIAVVADGSSLSAYWYAHHDLNWFDVTTGDKIFSWKAYRPAGHMVTDGYLPYYATFAPAVYTFYHQQDFINNYNAPSSVNPNHFFLAADSTQQLFFAHAYTGSILLTTATETPVITGQNQMYGLAVDDTKFYWLSKVGAGYEVRRAPKAGGAVESIYASPSGTPSMLLLHGGFLYWAVGMQILRIGK